MSEIQHWTANSKTAIAYRPLKLREETIVYIGALKYHISLLCASTYRFYRCIRIKSEVIPTERLKHSLKKIFLNDSDS